MDVSENTDGFIDREKGMKMKSFVQRYRNAAKAVRQIRAGEWVPRYNPISGRHLTAERGDMVLWIGNGVWFCEIDEKKYFGLFWRHYVWWFAARKLRNEADSAYRREVSPTPTL